MDEIPEDKIDSSPKKPDRTGEKLAKEGPEASVAAHREALKANPNKRFTLSPEGSTGQSFGLTENGKLIASKHNSEKVFYDHAPGHSGNKEINQKEQPDNGSNESGSRARATEAAHSMISKIAGHSLDIPRLAEKSKPDSSSCDLNHHSGRTAGVNNLKDIAEMAHGFADGFKEATGEMVKGSIDYLGKHNLVKDVASSGREALTTAFDYYAVHFRSGDSKGIANDAQLAGGKLWDGLKQWSDNYSKSDHYERGKQAGKLSLLFAAGGVGEAELAGAAISNTSRHLGRMLSTAGRLEEVTSSAASTGRMLKVVGTAEKAEQLSSDLRQGQSVFHHSQSREMLYNKGGGLDHDYNSEGNIFKGQHNKLEARHSPEAVKSVDKLMEPSKVSIASAEHINTVKETLLSLPAEHITDLQRNGYKIHASRTIGDVLREPRPDAEYVYGCLETKSKGIVIPERAFDSSPQTFRQQGASTEGVVRHEVGHALDAIHGWTDKIFDQFQNNRGEMWVSFKTATEKLENEINLAKATEDTEGLAQLKERSKLYGQFSEYMTLTKGPQEVVADLYAIAHGGTNRHPAVLRKLVDGFEDVSNTLNGANWPRKPKFLGLF